MGLIDNFNRPEKSITTGKGEALTKAGRTKRWNYVVVDYLLQADEILNVKL